MPKPPKSAKHPHESVPTEAAPDFVANALRNAGIGKGALAAALTIWAGARKSATSEEQACEETVQALVRERMHPAAEAVAAAAAIQFPASAWPLGELAALRARAGDHNGSLAYASKIRDAFPEDPAGYRYTLTALMGLDRKHEAQIVFRDLSLDPGQHTLHREEWFLILGIKLGMQRADYGVTALYAAALREVSPENPAGYVGGAAALRELERPEEAQAVATEGVSKHPDNLFLWKELALAAQDRNQIELAFERWNELTRRFPKSVSGYVGAIGLSNKLIQPKTTQKLLNDALKAFPHNAFILGAAARFALQSNRTEEASQHWQTLIERSPDDPTIQLAAAKSLMSRKRGRIKRVPDVLGRLEKMHAEFPDFAPAYTLHLNVLREAGKIGQAVKLAAAWAEKFPAEQDLAIARAMIAEEREEPAAALAIIEAVRARSAPTPACEAAYVRALCLIDRIDEAETVCQAALADFPSDPPILTEHVRIATRRGDWSEALRRAVQALRKRPRDGGMMKLVQSVKAQVVDDDELLASIMDETTPTAGSLAGADATPEETAVLLACESLGATSAGCEFGLVQRRFGAEPFGMFRWALIAIDRLTYALRNQFAEVGSDDTTELAIRRESASHQEYYVVDKKVGYLTHTFVKVEDSPQDRMLKQSIRRVRFLKAKLIEDLHAAEKIFIYKYALKFDLALLREMFAAVRSYGNGTVLCMTLADATHPKGTIEMIEPGLFVGRTGFFMDAVVPDEQGVDTEIWFAMCKHVVDWHAGQRARAAA